MFEGGFSLGRAFVRIHHEVAGKRPVGASHDGNEQWDRNVRQLLAKGDHIGSQAVSDAPLDGSGRRSRFICSFAILNMHPREVVVRNITIPF